MGIILSGMYRRQSNPTIVVPSPSDDVRAGRPVTTPYWYDHSATHAAAAANAGVTHWLLPPSCMSSAKDFPTADGFGVYNDYDLGSDSNPTRYGTAERLQRLCAILHANGIKPLGEWIPHQRSGGPAPGNYRYKSASGEAGRFPKYPSYFRERYRGEGLISGRVKQDPVASPFDDYMFGDEFCPINALPKMDTGKSVLLYELQRACDWWVRRLDLGGFRNDCTKGQAISAVRALVNYASVAGKIYIGEYAEGNKDVLAWWCSNFMRNGLPYHMTYDFEVKYRCRDFANNASRYDMRKLVNAGLASKGWPWASASVPFVENHDSDTNGFGAVVFNKVLAYAWLFMSEGFPSVYWRDWSAFDPYCYGGGDVDPEGNHATMQQKLNNLMWIHENLAGGPTVWRHAEYQFVVMERTGYEQDGKPGLLGGLNNDTWDTKWKRAYVQTHFGPRRKLHDYTGHGEDIWTDNQGKVELWIPPNNRGKGYVCYAPDGYSKPMQQRSWRTTQEFEGARDLDILPASIGRITPCTRIWVAKDTEVNLDMVTHQTDVLLQPIAHSPSGEVIRPRVAVETMNFTAREEGWYALKIDATASRAFPEGTPFDYILRAEYKAPKTLAGS